MMPSLSLTDFHLKYYRILNKFAHGEIKRLIITVPPQHGKSQGSTRLLPAYIMGLNPDCKMAVASYADTFAKKFNRDVQRIIDTPVYAEIFPETRLNSKNVVTTTSYLRNSNEFEVVDKKGSLKAVGRGGGLTGNPVDVMILDDLYKDAMEANSPTIRDSVWEWYSTVVKTRLHNGSQELIVFTRWHEQDLIGILEEKTEVRTLNSFSDIDPAFDGFYKLNFEAIKTGAKTELDPREVGVPLWSQRHSTKSLLEKRELDPHGFECLYQGNPSSNEGLLYGRFETYTELPEFIHKVANYTDTADMGEDKLCSICYAVDKDGKIYILDVLYTSEPMEVTEPLVANMLTDNGVRVCNIESNNGGRGFARNVQRLAPKVSVQWFHQSANKESRILSNSASVTKTILMPAGWESRWKDFHYDVTTYKRLYRANRWHDAPDVLTGIIEKDGRGTMPINKRISFI